MRPVKTTRSNLVYRGDGADIIDLHCERATLEGGSVDGGGVIYSVWKLSEGEREHVARGGKLKVGILFMEPIPPVSLEIVDEEEAKEEVA